MIIDNAEHMLKIIFIDNYMSIITLSNNNEPDNKFVELTQKQFVIISKYNCITIEIDDKIITNIPENIIYIKFGEKFNLDFQPYLHSGIKYLKLK